MRTWDVVQLESCSGSLKPWVRFLAHKEKRKSISKNLAEKEVERVRRRLAELHVLELITGRTCL
jgi:hypothetical protein